MVRSTRAVLQILTLGVAAVPHRAMPAQTLVPSGGIIGRMVDLQSGTPVRDVHIALLGTAMRTASDSIGRFTIASVPGGTYILQARAIGYEVTSWMVPIEEGVVLEQAFELPPLGGGDTLAPIIVEGTRSYFQRRMVEFEERRHAGRGVFVTEEQIKHSKAATLMDVLRGIPGVRLSCRLGSCVVEMTRSARGVCRADWVVDGFPATESSTPNLPAVGVVAIEVYRSPGETPSQFLKSNQQCGVIAIWTKSGP